MKHQELKDEFQFVVTRLAELRQDLAANIKPLELKELVADVNIVLEHINKIENGTQVYFNLIRTGDFIYCDRHQVYEKIQYSKGEHRRAAVGVSDCAENHAIKIFGRWTSVDEKVADEWLHLYESTNPQPGVGVFEPLWLACITKTNIDLSDESLFPYAFKYPHLVEWLKTQRKE